MKKIKKTAFAFFLVVIMAISAFALNPAEAEYVVFGMYPQKLVDVTPQIKNAEFDEHGDAVVGDKKYRKIEADKETLYFLYEPIVWQKVDNLLVARNVIDCKMYDEQEVKIKDFMGGIKYADSVTWEECSLRKWLNDEFASVAFTENELARISEEIRLLTVDEAQNIRKEELGKCATEYAIQAGVEKRSTEYSLGDCSWFLKDISKIISSAVCTVDNLGAVNTGMTVLVNEEGIGVVPCIAINDFSGLTTYMEALPESQVELYYPGGRTVMFKESEVPSAVANGWYTDKSDAMFANGYAMKARFESSAINSNYNWRLYNSKGRSPHISISAAKKNMTVSEVIDFIKPLMDTFYTGKMEDYMEIHVECVYTKEYASSWDEFSDTIGKSIHDAAEACWSGWGNIACSDGGAGRLTGTSGAEHTVTLRLKTNSDGSYSLSKTYYNDILHALAREAMAYSSRPIGQIQYLRHYFGQNTVYDGRQFNNEPSSLISLGVGVCGSYANFASDFCRLLGIPCLVYVNHQRSHAWNGIYLEGKWYHMDHTGYENKEYMRELYSDYIVDTFPFDHNPDGFPDEHNAENVSFLYDTYHTVENLTEAELAYVKSIFVSSETVPVTPAPTDGNKEVTVLLNGKKIEFDVLPIIENGRTLVPMRKIFETLGATVYWNESTFTATGVKGVTVVTIAIDSNIMTKNGENITLDVPARLVNSRTLVPVRVIAESFGLTVDWDEDTYTVIINETPAS